MWKNTTPRTLTTICLGLLAAKAQASGFQVLEQNASGLGNAYAGSAVTGENASTVFFNPAAMTKLEGSNVSTGLVLQQMSYKFTNEGSSATPAPVGSDGGNAGGLLALPNLYVTHQINPKWFAGLGMNMPFRQNNQYNNDWAGRFQSTRFDIETYNVNPSLAYKANEQWSFALGLNWQQMKARYDRYAATVAPAYQNTLVGMQAQGDSWGWNTGVTYKPNEATDIGFSYRSRVTYSLTGTVNSTSSGPVPAGLPRGNIKIETALPDTLILSASQRLSERWTVLGDISSTLWSTINNVSINNQYNNRIQVIRANFRDTWRLALGSIYKVGDQWKLKFGVAYDQTPVRGDSARLASVPDNDRYWYTVGAQWAPDRQSTVDIGLAYIHIPKSEIEKRTASQGNLIGSYTSSGVQLGVQYSMRF